MALTFLHEAELKLWEAVAFYEEKAPGLGIDFLNEVEKCLMVLEEQPERWPLRDDGTRRVSTNRFPYILVYTCHKDLVWIIAVAHCKRRSAYWKGRVEEVG